jgi:hypothetical protein
LTLIAAGDLPRHRRLAEACSEAGRRSLDERAKEYREAADVLRRAPGENRKAPAEPVPVEQDAE